MAATLVTCTFQKAALYNRIPTAIGAGLLALVLALFFIERETYVKKIVVAWEEMLFSSDPSAQAHQEALVEQQNT